MPQPSPPDPRPPRRLADAPPPPPGASAGPLPPPVPDEAGAPRSGGSAAAWVAGTGALLLLAAAGTFLAVSWDTMSLTARVAVVAAGTAGAVVGGHRLRRRLPAVGGVVFHLGALLVPVDALGLALQLEAGPAGRWLAVGLTSVVVLPLLAAAGRSNVLWWGAVAGVPVLATGIGLSGDVPAPLVVAGIALVLAAASQPSRATLRPVSSASWTLAAVAVHLPVAVATVAPLPGRTLDHLAGAGWQPVSWRVVAVSTVVAVAALCLLARAARSRPLVSLTVVSAVVGSLTALLPAAPAEAVLVVLPSLVFAVVEVAALTWEPDPRWGRATEVVGWIAESVAVAAGLPLLLLGLAHVHGGVGPDRVAGVAIALAGIGWAVAAGRRVAVRGWRTAAVPFGVGMAAVHASLAVVVAGGPVGLAAAALLAAAVATLAWRPPELGRSTSASPVVQAWLVAQVVVLGLGGLAVLLSLSSSAAVAVVLVLAVVLGLHVRTSGATSDATVAALLWLLVPVGVTTLLVGSFAVARLPGAVAAWAAIVAAVALLGMATLSEPRRWVAHAVRVVAAVVGSFATSVIVGPSVSPSLDGTARSVQEAFALGPGALLPASVVGGWLLADAVRCREPAAAAFAAPVLVRLAASLALVATDARTAGVVLLAAGVAAALIAAVGVGRWTAPLAVGAASAAATGILLVGATPQVRAALIVATGVVVAAAGAARRNAAVGHLGGVVAVTGCWQLFALREVTALDVWVAPLALQLWIAGALSRRRSGTSSWVADVPPLLLLGVPALVERAVGGSGWHAVAAGALGVVAVVGGGNARLGGPLVVGTALLVAVVGVEVFAVVVVVPTWIWLALGGVTLVAAGAAMELVDGTPVSATRRLVGVVRERFD